MRFIDVKLNECIERICKCIICSEFERIRIK